MRGRPPLPVPLKLVKGNPGKRPITRPAMLPAPQGKARKPAGLSPEAAAEWNRLAPALRRLGLLGPRDLMFFVAYCEATATFTRANAKVKEQGELVLNADGLPIRNPWLKVRSDAAAEIRAFGSE